MHRYVGSQLEGRAAPTEGHVRRHWRPTPTPLLPLPLPLSQPLTPTSRPTPTPTPTLNLPSTSSPTPTPNQVRRYWVQNLSGPGVSYNDDGDGWFSHANLHLA